MTKIKGFTPILITSVTRIQANIVLEKEVFPGIWQTVKSWPNQTTNSFIIHLAESVPSSSRTLYRLAVDATVYSGSNSEPVSTSKLGTY